MDKVYTSTLAQWPTSSSQDSLTASFTTAVENGAVVHFPNLAFTLLPTELALLSPALTSPRHKNISFKGKLQGFQGDATQAKAMQQLLVRYQQTTVAFIQHSFPTYKTQLRVGRTSFRPVEIAGRSAPSYRKDDTRLHVDAFPATPNQGQRILRVFSNIHAHKSRDWRLGEDFAQVAQYFLPRIRAPLPGSATLLRLCRITRSLRSAYDHYMLQIHDRMKQDIAYQQSVKAQAVSFAAQSTWIVYTDQVSHAALAGQHVLEQTFYLPIDAMAAPDKSPLRQLEQQLGKKLT